MSQAKNPLTATRTDFGGWAVQNGKNIRYYRHWNGTEYNYSMMYFDDKSNIETSSLNGPRFAKLRGRINAAIIATI